MLKVLAYLGAGVVVVVAVVLIYAATKPDSFRIARSVSIQAPPEKIFPLINDYANGRHGRPTRTRSRR